MPNYLNNLHDNNTLTDNLMNVTYNSPSEYEMVAAAFGQEINVLNNYSAAPQYSLNVVFDHIKEPTYMRTQRDENCFSAINLSSADGRYENILMTDLDNSKQLESVVGERNESIRIACFNHAEIQEGERNLHRMDMHTVEMVLQSAEIKTNDINTDLNAVNPTPLTIDERNEASRSLAISEKTSRKKKINNKNWKRYVAMISLQRGESYINSKGKLIPKKVPPELLCTARCHLKCKDINIDHKKDIFKSFNEMEEDAKNAYLFGCIEANLPQQVVISETYYKNIYFKYFINCDGVKRKICKKAFCAIHRIGPAKVSHMGKQAGTGKPTAKSIAIDHTKFLRK